MQNASVCASSLVIAGEYVTRSQVFLVQRWPFSTFPLTFYVKHDWAGFFFLKNRYDFFLHRVLNEKIFSFYHELFLFYLSEWRAELDVTHESFFLRDYFRSLDFIWIDGLNIIRYGWKDQIFSLGWVLKRSIKDPLEQGGPLEFSKILGEDQVNFIVTQQKSPTPPPLRRYALSGPFAQLFMEISRQ